MPEVAMLFAVLFSIASAIASVVLLFRMHWAEKKLEYIEREVSRCVSNQSMAIEQEKRWKIERKLDAIMDHVKCEFVERPAAIIVKERS